MKLKVEKVKDMMNNRKWWILFQSTKDTLYFIDDLLFWLLFLVIVVYKFLCTTAFALPWTTLAEDTSTWGQLLYMALSQPQLLLMPIVAAKYIFSNRYDKKEYAAALLIFAAAYYAERMNGDGEFLTYVLLILGARGSSFDRLLKIYFAVTTGILLVTVIGSQAGWIENLVYLSRNGREALGFIYPTDFAAHVLFAALIYCYIRRRDIWYPEALEVFILSMFTWFVSKARFSTALLILLSVLLGVYVFLKKNRDRFPWIAHIREQISDVLVWAPLVCCMVIHVFSIFYSGGSAWMTAFDAVLNDRLELARRGIDSYGFRLWGSHIPMIGNGGSIEERVRYYYIDSSFMQISMLNGLVALLLVLLLCLAIGVRAKKNHNWMLLLVFLIVAVHGMFEHHSFDMAYHPFFMAAFAKIAVPLDNISVRRKLIGRVHDKE